MPYEPQSGPNPNVVLPARTIPGLGTGFVAVGGTPTPLLPYWWQDGNGVVHIGGQVNGPAGPVGYAVLWASGTLPTKARPVNNNVLLPLIYSGIVLSAVRIGTDGHMDIYLPNVTAQTFYLDGLTYLAGV